MDKKKISDVRAVEAISMFIGLEGNELVKSANIQRNLSYVVAENDLDILYKYVGAGSHMFNYDNNTTNVPAVGNPGTIIHIQRSGRGISTPSQMIIQVLVDKNGLHVRTGVGSSSVISYKAWKSIN